MSKVDEVINKSLDEIDEMLKSYTGAVADTLSKGGNIPPEEVSQDVPEEEEGNKNPNPEQQEGSAEAPEAGNEGEGEGEDRDTDEEEDEDEGDDTQKSLKGTLTGNENVRKALEVSDFLSSLVDELVGGIAKALNVHSANLTKSIQTTEDSNDLLAKSFMGLAKAQRAILESQSEIAKSMASISSRLSAIESQPTVRKSVASSTQVKPLEKSFAGVDSNKSKMSNTLSKSEALTKLSGEFDKGNTGIAADILALEGTGDFNSLSATAKGILGI